MSTGTDCGTGFCIWTKNAAGIWSAASSCVNDCQCDPSGLISMPHADFVNWTTVRGITLPAGAASIQVGCYKPTGNPDG